MTAVSRTRLFVLGIAVYSAVAVTGVWVAMLSQEAREHSAALHALRLERDALLVTHSRLLLERGALASYQNVESIAEAELAMRFPVSVEQVGGERPARQAGGEQPMPAVQP